MTKNKEEKMVGHFCPYYNDDCPKGKPKEEIKEIRKLIANLISASGCSCCRDEKEWERAQGELAKLLNVPRYDDDSGWDFHKFRTIYK